MTAIPFNNNRGVILPSANVRLRLGDSTFENIPLIQLFGQIANLKDIHVPLTGDTYTIPDQVTQEILKPAGTIAALTLKMPANPYDGQQVSLSATQTVTTLTHQANTGQTLNNALTTIGAASTTWGAWLWDQTSATWYGVP